MRLNNVVFCGGPVSTTGAVTASVVEVSVASLVGEVDASFHLEGILVASVAGGDVASTRVARSAKHVAGILSVLGTQASPVGVGVGDAGLATIVATLDASGGVLRLRATGIALTTISWTGHLHIWSSEF